ncbi:MAG: SDR family NAD(P)-dependent oxidoreductase [Endozoicomonas sp.]
MKKTALITGGTGGLGLATARFLVEKGWQVYAADANQAALDSLDSPGITPLFMDVTQTESVQKAYDTISADIDCLDAVINFAGILRVGSMAEMEEQTLETLMQINVMGTFRVNRAFFPLLNKPGADGRKGRIVNISSETGWQSGHPFNGAYAMSKHAIEGYSDSLRREMMMVDVPVIKIQPGPFKTNMVASIEANFQQAADKSELFSKQLLNARSVAINENKKANDPRIISETIFQALTVNKPKAAYSVKPDLVRTLLEYLPTRWVDPLMKAGLSK